MRRFGVILASAGALLVAGSTSAQAWTWAYSSSPLIASFEGLTRGGGYGSIDHYSYDKAVLRSTLADFRADGMRTFVYSYSNAGNGRVESGRRDDGGTTYARMSDKYLTAPYPTSAGQYSYYAKVCMDRSWADDPCSALRGPGTL
jgi:hypothetical protein